METPFDGYAIDVPIQAIRLTPHQRQVVRSTADETTQALRFNCLVAEAVNEAFGVAQHGESYCEIKLGRRVFLLNPKAKAQFGVTYHGDTYLTVGLLEQTASGTLKYRLTWKGENVPQQFKELAVAHDEGQNTTGCVVELPLGAAQVREIQGGANGHRSRHDIGPGGTPYPRADRRKHRRVCAADLGKKRRKG